MARSDGNAPGVQDARIKLDGLLKDLVKKTEESFAATSKYFIMEAIFCYKKTSSEDEVSSSLGSSVSYSMPPPSTPTKRSSSGKTPRKRRKKDAAFDETEGASQNPSFVKKLFDRSVDFAQFNEDTPLYVLARAWMRNKPYGTKSFDAQDNQEGDSPSSSQEQAMFISGHSNGDSHPNSVYSFPDPIQLKEDKDGSRNFPDPKNHGPLSLDIHYDPEKAPSVHELKRSHVDQWKKVKIRWREYSCKKQASYAPSIQKIRELFEH